MAPLSVLDARPKSKVVKLTTNSRLYKTVIKAIQDKKGGNIISLDLRKIHEAVADFFVICQANNQPQIRAITDFVEEEVRKKCSESPYHYEGKENMHWVILDYVNVVVHIMMPEQRKFYKLEEMWSDADPDDYSL